MDFTCLLVFFCLFAVVIHVSIVTARLLVGIFAQMVNVFVCVDRVSLGSPSLCSWPLRLMCVLF